MSLRRVWAAAQKGCDPIKVIKRRIHMLTMLMLAVFALMTAYFCYSVYFYGG